MPTKSDLMRDCFKAPGNFRKPGEVGRVANPERFTFRAMSSCRGAQILYSRIREGGVGSEFSQLSSKLAIGANVLNQTVRGKGRNAKRMAGKLTLCRLRIIGDRGVTLQNTIASRKAALQEKKSRRPGKLRNKKKHLQGHQRKTKIY